MPYLGAGANRSAQVPASVAVRGLCAGSAVLLLMGVSAWVLSPAPYAATETLVETAPAPSKVAALTAGQIDRFIHTPLTKIKSKIDNVIHGSGALLPNVTRKSTWAFVDHEIHTPGGAVVAVVRNETEPAWIKNLSGPTEKYGAVPPWAANLTDSKVSACDDFYSYACGSWIQDAVVPPDKTQVVKAFDHATDRVANLMKEFLQTDKGKAGILYRSCMDVKAIDARGIKPYMDEETKKKVEAVKDERSLMLALAAIASINGNALFGLSVDADSADPTKYSFYLNQAGLSLPDIKMYSNPKMKPLLAAYAQEQVKILQLVGVSAVDAAKWSKASMDIESEIANFTTPPAQARSETGAEAYTLKELMNATGLRWDIFFEGLGKKVGVDRAEIRSLSNMQYFQKLADMIKSRPAASFQPYLQWNVLMLLIGHLTEDMVKAKLGINKDLFGVNKFPPRWRMCHDTLASEVPTLLSKLYIDNAYHQRDGEIASHMLGHVHKAFEKLINNTEWIAPVRAAALSKLQSMFLEVGHPKSWLKFDPSVNEKKWYENSIKMARWAVQTALNKLGTTVERRSWGDSGVMCPMAVNAAYASHVNGLFIPAGVLQTPFFSDGYPVGWNFGALGVLMGHEMTHGFDDQGRQYDNTGKLSNWWTKDVLAEYKKRAQCMGSYYSTFKEFGKSVNGNLTMGENIADNGGMRIAWDAMQAVLATLQQSLSVNQRQSARAVAGKQFFLSWAQMWCAKTSKKAALLALATDVHAPDNVRVNAPLSQFPEFGETFGCKPGSKMNPTSPRCRLW